MSRLLRTACLTGIAIASGVVPALAHHPMGGATPVTFLQGLLSGFGHPVLGLDHLAALVVVGLLGAIDLPGAEFLVAGSLVAIALIAVVLPALSPAVMGPVFAIGGVAHGHALAESIVGAEPMPLVAYLIGLVVVQSAVTTAVAVAARRMFPVAEDVPAAFRAAAGAMGAVGLVFLVIAARGLA
jgi:urease accessory protein